MAVVETTENPPKVKTDDVERALSMAFNSPAWQVLFGVRNDSGFNANRTADAIAIGIWPSTNHVIHGFEIKVSRSDWLRELKDPWKAEEIGKYCDHWSLVVGARNIVKPDELPKGWGLYSVECHSLRCLSKPEAREAVPMTRGFFASLIKRMSAAPEATVLKTACDKSYADGVQKGKESSNAGQTLRELEELHVLIKQFENASGVKIDTWQAGNIGRAVKCVLRLNYHRVRHVAELIEGANVSVAELVDAMKLFSTDDADGA